MKKISFKKILLIIKNNYSINRSLPLILALGICILGSIIGAMPISDLESRYAMRLEAGFATMEEYRETIKYLFDDMLTNEGIFSIMLMIVAFALPFFAVISLMGFMRDKSGVDFYHSMSVNRKEIYLAHYITAFINSGLTIVLSQTLGLFFLDLIAKEPPYSFGEMFVMQLPVMAIALLYLALFLAIAMISAIISGTVFSSIISYAFINFYIPATVLAVALSGDVLFNSKLFQFLEHKPHVYPYTSPFIRYIFGLNGDEYLPFTALSFVLIALGTVAMIVLGMWLYSKKKNENSLKPIAFNIFKRPLQYLIAFDMILLGATFFEAITDSLIWCIIGGLIALLFTFIVTNAFFDKSFAGVFKKSRHMAIILLFTIVLGVIFVADVFGIYKEIKPDIKNMEHASLYFGHDSDNNNYNYDFYFNDSDDEERAYHMDHAELLDNTAKKEIMELFNLIKKIEEKRGQKAIDRVYEDGRIYDSISLSMNFRCRNDFSSYYEHIYLVEGEEGFKELREILETLSTNYSHTLSYNNEETGEWLHEEVIH